MGIKDPPAMPTSISADRTASVAGAKGGNWGNSLPKSCGLAGAPGRNPGSAWARPPTLRRETSEAAPAVPDVVATKPAPAAAIPARNCRRVGPSPGVVVFIGGFLVLRAHCRYPFSCPPSAVMTGHLGTRGTLRMPEYLSQGANCLLGPPAVDAGRRTAMSETFVARG